MNANWDLILLEAIVAPLASLDPSSLTETQINSLISYVYGNWGVDTIDFMIGALFTTLGLCIVSKYLYKKYLGENPSFLQSIKEAFNKKMIGVLIILGILIPIGNFLLVFPAIIIFGFFIFSVYTYQIDFEVGSLKEARRISKGAFWKIIGVFLISSFTISALTLLYQIFIVDVFFPITYSTFTSWFDPANPRVDLIIIINLVNKLFVIILEPLFICLLTPIFVHMNTRKKLGYGDLRQIKYQQVYAPPTQPEFVENGIFCPFCGQHMDFKLKYCPSCGESIEFLTK
jgi:hypothetical protein